MYKSWTNVDARFVSLGVLPQGRSIRACRNFCNRHGIDFPGKKEIDNINQRIRRIEDEADNLENPDGGRHTVPQHSQSHNTPGKSAAGGKSLKTITQRKDQNMNQDKFREIAVSKIRENPNNPRSEIGNVEDLKASINANGLLQNITVRPLDDGTFEVIAGSRRYKACRELGMQKVPCTIIEADAETAYTLATTENIVRENMTAVDEANAVAKLFAQGKTRTEIGAMFGKSARWAEGRRRITELGDKAMKYLAEGRINLGHAEVLTMCSPEDVNKYLEFATWKNPEELKRAVMDSRPLLERAPFDAKKVCKNCEKRSDRQLDLFGDVQCSYCLDRECFEAHVKKEAEYWRKKFLKDGLEEVPEDDRMDAENEWNGYVSTSTEDEDEREFVKDSIAEGKKPMFWVNEKTAEWGHVFRHEEYFNENNDDEAEDDADRNEDPDSWDWQMNHMDYKRREKIRCEASEEEKRIVANKLKGVFGNISRTAKAFILAILNRVHEDENGNQETYLKHQHRAEDDFLDEVADHIVNWYNGVDDDIREFLEMDSREEFERNANALIGEDWKPEDDKEEE
jgi:ParB-like partition proteins